jgi:hypothetical protein
MLTKWEIGGLAVVGYLLISKTSKAATSPGGSMSEADLLRRANQTRAQEWVPIMVYDLDVPEAQAEAAARWFGIESGGDPEAVSSQGERGLSQVTKTTALTEKALTPTEWAALADVTTSMQDDARIALKVIHWCYQRATKHLHTPPTDPIDQLFYAKLYHQSPVDVRDAKLTGNALEDSARLETVWSSDAKKLHYLHAANVVAWNDLHAPRLVAEK